MRTTKNDLVHENYLLKTEIEKLKEENKKLKYELNCRAWFNVWKDELKFRLEEIYNVHDKTDEWILEIADRMSTSDYVTERTNECIDVFLEEAGVKYNDDDEEGEN